MTYGFRIYNPDGSVKLSVEDIVTVALGTEIRQFSSGYSGNQVFYSPTTSYGTLMYYAVVKHAEGTGSAAAARADVVETGFASNSNYHVLIPSTKGTELLVWRPSNVRLIEFTFLSI